ncbi:MAG: carboxypeptidase regulatory-like domain-containing protein [Bacteroidales bacterium]|jgi:hypothetical protein|nr:carboxypeptidase regulatory-like domain-containing protein [Bacteroidales bacterium]
MKRFYLKLTMGILIAFVLGLISCTKEKATGSIQGIVTNVNTSEPIQGVNISLSPTGASAVTGSDGRYEFHNLEVGNYTVQGMKAGFESNTKNISITAGNVSSGDMQLRPTVSGFRLNVEYLDFSTNFSQLQFKIINASATLPLSWEIMESMNWMTVTPSTGNLQGGQEATITVNIDRSLIPQSTTANLTVRSADQSVVLPVNVSVSGNNGPQLQLSETLLDFGTSANSLAFYVMNTGPVGTSLNWVCSNINVSWLTLMPTSGNTAGGASTMVTAIIDRSQISGMVSTSVTVNGAGTSQAITFSAAASGTGTAILQLSEGSLDFGETETTKTFQVKNVGSPGTVLNWSINAPSESWLTVAPLSGNTNAGSGTPVTVVVDRSQLQSSVSANIMVSGGGNNSNLSVSVTYVDNGMVVPSGLQCYYIFDDGTANDLTDNGVDAVLMNSATTVADGARTYLKLNMITDDYLNIPYNLFRGLTSWSVCFWIKDFGAGNVFSGWNTGSSSAYGDAPLFWAMQDGKFKIKCRSSYMPDGGDAFSYNYTNIQADGSWHFVVVTMECENNVGNAKLYVDGSLKDQITTTHHTSTIGDASKISFGGSKDGLYPFSSSMKLDNIRIYNRTITAAEVQLIYNAER